MNPLYNTAIRFYAAAAQIVSLRSGKVRKMLRGQHQTIAILKEKLAGKERPVWFHASSLGEFEQARPMIERLKRQNPSQPILLSFFSPSGYEVRKNYHFADAVVYLPFDTPHRVRRFLDAANPAVAIFVKYEFWGNYLSELHRRDIPTYLISAIFRPRQRFFRWWGGMFRKMLTHYTHLYLQDQRSRRLLKVIGITNVTVAGDTRFDRVSDIMQTPVDIPGIEGFAPAAPLKFIAGSSWPADEDIYIPWLNANPDIPFIIAPHEFNETRLETLRNRFTSGRVMMLSEWIYHVKEAQKKGDALPPWAAQIRGLIVDSFGKLSTLYRYATIAYIGGGFGAGIHNLNEAAVYSIPVIFGPNHTKFKEATDLINVGGGHCVANKEEFADVIDNLRHNPATLARSAAVAGAYIADNLGATDIIYRDLFGN